MGWIKKLVHSGEFRQLMRDVTTAIVLVLARRLIDEDKTRDHRRLTRKPQEKN